MRSEEEILKYLKNELSEGEHQSFEAEMKVNSRLADSVYHSKVLNRILDQDTEIFSKKVRDVVASNRKKKQGLFFYFKLAAAVAILALPTYFIINSNDSSSDELVDEFLTPYPDILTSRGNENPLDLSAYNNGDYTTAINVLSASLNTENDLLARLYVGVSYLMIDDYTKALKTFDNPDLQESQFKHDVMWYESLTLLKLGRNQKANGLLQTLKKESPFYSAKANQLLRKMEWANTY